ncbi:hypothetical protein ACVNIS_24790 (plasmid) [Sphaerotilaceae bacterium SBD11-9]
MNRVAAISFVATLAACSGDTVPAVADPHNIVVDGKPMTAAAFLSKYCSQAQAHPTCAAVGKAMRSDASKGPTPKGW